MDSEAQVKPNPPGFEASLAGNIAGRKSLKIQVSFRPLPVLQTKWALKPSIPATSWYPWFLKSTTIRGGPTPFSFLFFELPALISHNPFWISPWPNYIISSLDCSLHFDIHFVVIGDGGRRCRRRWERKRWREGERGGRRWLWAKRLFCPWFFSQMSVIYVILIENLTEVPFWVDWG